eukprot:scaffold22879_cov191-Cylindrotheca_fusiformis.AAC.2
MRRRQTRGIICHAIEITGNVIPKLGEAVEPLVHGHHSQNGSSGRGRGDRAPSIPVEGGEVVSARFDGPFTNVETLGGYVIVEGAAPDNGPRGFVALADQLAVAIEDGEAALTGSGGGMWKPDTPRPNARGIMGPNDGRCGRDQFLQACRARA